MNVDRMQQLVLQMRALAAQAAAAPQLPGSSAGAATAQTGAADFGSALQSALGEVNNQILQADKLQAGFAGGNSNVSLSDVMLATQKATLSFQAALQVRNKLVSAYQDIMNIQA